jgi:8-oxo-dGTP diphosphatase
MNLRAARIMTSMFLTRDDRVLLLYRIGSSAVPDSWVGIGGHVEPEEIRDPAAAMLRELDEEIGITADDMAGLALRYVSLRDNGQELRITYYFTADLVPAAPAPTACTEGELRWFDLNTAAVRSLDMPPTASVALNHWLDEGHHDDLLRSIVMTSDGPRVLPLANS